MKARTVSRIRCVTVVLVLCTTMHFARRRFAQEGSTDAALTAGDVPKAELDALPESSVSSFNNCASHNELRHIDFAHSSLKYRLCSDSPAYTLVRGRFPLCQLNNNLPKLMYEAVTKAARIVTVRRAFRREELPVYAFSERDAASRQMLRTHNWETEEIRRMLLILKKFPTDSVTFMDIGSSLGLYSLQAREQGYPVIAVDANFRTLIRMQMTAKMLGLLDDRLKLFWCFLGDEVVLKTNPATDTIPVMTARIDDLTAHIRTKKVIIKMDIESGEHMFLQTGEKLFSEFDVPVLRMKFRPGPGAAANSASVYKFIVNFMTSRRYSLISMHTHKVLNIATFNELDGMWVSNDFLKLGAI